MRQRDRINQIGQDAPQEVERRIEALRAEIAAIERKRDGLGLAIEVRKQALRRMETIIAAESTSC